MTSRRPSSAAEHAAQTPLQAWRASLERGDINFDAAQEQVMLALQVVYDELLSRPGASPHRALRGPSAWLVALHGRSSWPAVPGIYLWGGVGRGKTYLVDLFYECLPLTEKRRLHFHRFMEMVHARLKELREAARTQQEPLALIAADIAADTRVLCFDEFYVSDIGDAMILATILDVLFARGVTLVATSNIAPDNLYKDGLQRARFLPAIKLINDNMRVMEIKSDTDYRMRALTQASIYYVTSGEVKNKNKKDRASEQRLAATFDSIATTNHKACELQILDRTFHSKRCGDGIVWFDFEELCVKPRSQNDYIELARLHHTLLLSDVPVMDEYSDDQARRFILLIDELYERNVNLILSGAARPDALYRGKRLRQMFERTHSRLLEMQSHEYLAREHKV